MKACPECHEPLSAVTADGLAADECPTCGGVWFDSGELRLAKDATDAELNWLDFEIWQHADDFAAKASERPCPGCGAGMISLLYGDTGVEIDHCPKCRGTWLDGDEFARIIDSLEKEVNTKSLSQYLKESLQEAKEVVTGPESVLSEWKDFTTLLKLMKYRLFVENPTLLNAIISVQRTNPLQ